jgi:uncharacterized small protein (DUF1192 family)
MNRIDIFELHIQPGNELVPARVQIALQRHSVDAIGRVVITPEATSLEEIEDQINALQDDLDQLRERARRVFGTDRRPSADALF